MRLFFGCWLDVVVVTLLLFYVCPTRTVALLFYVYVVGLLLLVTRLFALRLHVVYVGLLRGYAFVGYVRLRLFGYALRLVAPLRLLLLLLLLRRCYVTLLTVDLLLYVVTITVTLLPVDYILFTPLHCLHVGCCCCCCWCSLLIVVYTHVVVVALRYVVVTLHTRCCCLRAFVVIAPR